MSTPFPKLCDVIFEHPLILGDWLYLPNPLVQGFLYVMKLTRARGCQHGLQYRHFYRASVVLLQVVLLPQAEVEFSFLSEVISFLAEADRPGRMSFFSSTIVVINIVLFNFFYFF